MAPSSHAQTLNPGSPPLTELGQRVKDGDGLRRRHLLEDLGDLGVTRIRTRPMTWIKTRPGNDSDQDPALRDSDRDSGKPVVRLSRKDSEQLTRIENRRHVGGGEAISSYMPRSDPSRTRGAAEREGNRHAACGEGRDLSASTRASVEHSRVSVCAGNRPDNRPDNRLETA